jgi:hypothetical protein
MLVSKPTKRLGRADYRTVPGTKPRPLGLGLFTDQNVAKTALRGQPPREL